MPKAGTLHYDLPGVLLTSRVLLQLRDAGGAKCDSRQSCGVAQFGSDIWSAAVNSQM